MFTCRTPSSSMPSWCLRTLQRVVFFPKTIGANFGSTRQQYWWFEMVEFRDNLWAVTTKLSKFAALTLYLIFFLQMWDIWFAGDTLVWNPLRWVHSARVASDEFERSTGSSNYSTLPLPGLAWLWRSRTSGRNPQIGSSVPCKTAPFSSEQTYDRSLQVRKCEFSRLLLSYRLLIVKIPALVSAVLEHS